jgi:hypothetical protein
MIGTWTPLIMMIKNASGIHKAKRVFRRGKDCILGVRGMRRESPEILSPNHPHPYPEAVKKFRQREIWGARVCPGKGQIQAAKTGAGFSVAVVVFNPVKGKR